MDWYPKYIKNLYSSTPKHQSNLKMGRRPEEIFLQRKHPDGQQTWKDVEREKSMKSMKIPQKIKHRNIWVNNSTSKNMNSESFHTPLFIAALFTIANTWEEATSVSINRLMDKESVVYIYNGIAHNYKKGWDRGI